MIIVQTKVGDKGPEKLLLEPPIVVKYTGKTVSQCTGSGVPPKRWQKYDPMCQDIHQLAQLCHRYMCTYT